MISRLPSVRSPSTAAKAVFRSVARWRYQSRPIVKSLSFHTNSVSDVIPDIGHCPLEVSLLSPMIFLSHRLADVHNVDRSFLISHRDLVLCQLLRGYVSYVIG